MLGFGGSRRNRDFADEEENIPTRYNSSTDYSRDRSDELVVREKPMLLDKRDYFCELRGDVPGPGEYKIFIVEPALKTLWQHAKEGLPAGVAGLLLGGLYYDPEMDENYVEIHYAFPSASSFNEEMNLRVVNRVIAEMEKVSLKSHPGEIVTGWYHTHPGLGIFFSENDKLIHETFYIEPSNIALILDPLMEIDPLRETYKNIAFFYWKDNNIEKSNGYFAYKQRCAESISPIDKLREKYHRRLSRTESISLDEARNPSYPLSASEDDGEEWPYSRRDDPHEDENGEKLSRPFRKPLQGIMPQPSPQERRKPLSAGRRLRRIVDPDEGFPLYSESDGYTPGEIKKTPVEARKDLRPKAFIAKQGDEGAPAYPSDETDIKSSRSDSLYIEFDSPEDEMENHYEEDTSSKIRPPSRASLRAKEMIMRKTAPSFVRPSYKNEDSYDEDKFPPKISSKSREPDGRGFEKRRTPYIKTASEYEEDYYEEERRGRTPVEAEPDRFKKKPGLYGKPLSGYEKEDYYEEEDPSLYRDMRSLSEDEKFGHKRKTNPSPCEYEEDYSDEKGLPVSGRAGGRRKKSPASSAKHGVSNLRPSYGYNDDPYDEEELPSYDEPEGAGEEGLNERSRENFTYPSADPYDDEEGYEVDKKPFRMQGNKGESLAYPFAKRAPGKRPGSGELQRVYPQIKYAAQAEEHPARAYRGDSEDFQDNRQQGTFYEETYYNQDIDNTRVLGGRTWKRQQSRSFVESEPRHSGKRRKSGLLKANKYKYYGGDGEEGKEEKLREEEDENNEEQNEEDGEDEE